MANKPTMELQAWPLKLAIWSQEKQQNGRTWTEYTYTLSKSFKRKGSDQYEEQKVTLFGDDLLKARALLEQAFVAGEITNRTP